MIGIRQLLVVAGVLLALAALWGGLTVLAPSLPWGPGDFYTLYSATTAVSRGISPYDHAAVARIQQAELGWDAASLGAPSLPYFYPPWYALLAMPLALLPFRTAMLAWFLVNLVALMVSCLLLLDLGGAPARRWSLMLLVTAAFFAPTLGDLSVGQYGMPVLLGLALAVRLAGRGSHATLLGAAMVLLTLKPQLGLAALAVIVVWHATRRAWAPLAWCGGLLAVLAAASFAVSGRWPQEMLSAQSAYAEWSGIPFPIKGCDSCSSVPALLEAALGAGTLATVAYQVVLAGLVLVLVLAWRARGNDLVFLVTLTSVLTVLGTPYLRNYDLVILVLPFVYIWTSLSGAAGGEAARPPGPWSTGRALGLIALLALYVLPLLLTVLGDRVAVGRSGVVMALGLLVLLLAGSSRRLSAGG